MPLPIKNGRIVTADSDSTGDIFCEGETITRIGRGLDALLHASALDAWHPLISETPHRA